MTALVELLRGAIEQRKALAEAAWELDWTVLGHRVFRATYGTPAAEHIAANDPARVKRECEEDLAVIERHSRDRDQYRGDSGPVVDVCMGCGFDAYEEWRERWPCPELRGLARRYGIEATS